MSRRALKILCTGDVHLGRYPARIPTGAESLSVRHVWGRIVDEAIDRGVDLLALTGDVIDRKNRYYEALGPFQRGVRRLGEAGIAVVAVSGNHDFDVLGSAAEVVEDEYFYLLGRRGRWESLRLEGDHAPVKVVGWSYPEQHVLNSPLSSLELEVDDEFTIGLLHADLDAPSSRYAPVTSSELGATAVDLWLLGHVHAPRRVDLFGGAVALYPGSPQALDPGEVGTHGPWIVEVERGSKPECRQLPLATVAYRRLEVNLDGVDDDDAFRATVPRRVLADLREVAGESEFLERVVYRLCYTGRTALHRRLTSLSRGLVEDWEERADGVVAEVDQVESATSLPVDLEGLARGEDPPAVLARVLVALRDGEVEGDAKRLLERVREAAEEVCDGNAYGPLRAEEGAFDEERLRELAMEEGLRLLDALRQQKRGGQP